MLRIVTAIFMWSSLGIFVRISGLPPHHIMFFSAVASSLCILGLIAVSAKLRQSFPRPGALLPMLLLGPVSLLNTFSFFYAYQNTSIANAVLTHYIAPVLVAFMAPFVIGERLTFRIILSVAVASVGLWVMLDMSLPEFTRLLFAGDTNTVGILSGLFSGVCYAILIILVRIYAQQYHPIVITFSQNIIIAVMLTPFASSAAVSPVAVWVILFIGIVHSTVAPALYFSGMKTVAANTAAILGYLEPVAAIVLGFIVFNEALSPAALLGGAMILFSGAIAIRCPRDP